MAFLSEIRLALTGERPVQAGLDATRGAVDRLHAAVSRYGGAAEESTKRSFLMNQALFTMRRYAYAGTLALTSLGAAAVVMGFKFNASMETNTVAFKQFLGSTEAATKELDYLYNLAKYTPFEFTNVTDAARRFLAFGYTLQDTNKYLKTIGDTVAAFGGGGSQIERMVLVFGQIRASGRLLGQDMLQLEQQGIPVIDILLKQLKQYGVTRKDLSKVGALGIPADIGIPALMRGMQERFGGMSAVQAKTFAGQISTLHDNLAQVMGAMTSSLFNQARGGVLPSLNKTFSQIGAIAKNNKNQISIGQVFDVLGKNYPKVKPFLDIITVLISSFKVLGGIVTTVVLPAFYIFAMIIDHLLLPPLRLILWVMDKLKGINWLLAAAVGFMTSMWILETVSVKINTFWKDMNKGADKFLTNSKLGLARMSQFLTWVINRESLAFLRLRIATLLSAIAMDGLISTMWGLAVGNPIGLIITAVVLLIAGIVILYFKWKWFHNLVNETAKFLWKQWKLTALALLIIFGPIAAIAFVVAKHWKLVWEWVQKVYHVIKDIASWAKTNWQILVGPFLPLIAAAITIVKLFKSAIHYIKDLAHWIGKLHAPGWLQAIGHAAAWVGEQAISPLWVGQKPWATAPAAAGGGALPVMGANQFASSVAAGKASSQPFNVTVHSNVHIDGKKVAESSAKHRQNQGARR